MAKNQRNKSLDQIVQVKILHATTYADIQQVTNNYLLNIINIGATIIGQPKLIVKDQNYLKKYKKAIYQADLETFIKDNPKLGLSASTSLSDLKQEGLKKLANHIDKILKSIQPQHYYMKIVYSIDRETIKNSQKILK